jgi:hypothetical protein
VADYQNLTDDEILHLAEDRGQLTEGARVLDSVLQRRGLSLSGVDSYRAESVATEDADKLKRSTTFIFTELGLA